MIDSSESEDENIIRYGTPLDAYEEDEVPTKRKFQQPADQYAVDAHGRRRFHGAFTGGFSAGYGNSVGTPEGWTPSNFKSSRSEKASVTNQKPEDFMDEEDRGEFGIAPRQLQTHRDFSGQKRQRKTFHDGPIPGEPVLEQLIRPVHESAAVKMLRKMGWREGQGIGDRLTRGEKRKAKDQHKVYGCYVPPEIRQELSESEESSDSEFDYETLFAPDDYEPYILQRKSDRFGLGYNGLSRHSVLGNLVGEYGEAGTSKSHLLMREKGKKVSIRGHAFGVGAFEADDEDIYATEDMSHYDFTTGENRDEVKPKKNIEKSVNVLEGFVKANKAMESVANYPPPALPRDYTPAPAGTRRTRFDATTKPQRDQGLGRHELTPDARGQMLGETPLPKADEEKEKDVIEKGTDSISNAVGKTIDFTPTARKTKCADDFIPIGDSGKEVPKTFRPFMNDPQKQTRYENYLMNIENGESDVRDKLSEWEKQREAIEFEQAAALYRPLTGAMGDRFTHASEPDDTLNPLCAVAKSSNSYGLATPEQIEAAKKSLYGVMTRKEISWRPEAIVSKRFNIPEIGGSKYEPQKEDKPKVSYSIFSYLESSVHDKESFTKEQSKFSGSKSLVVEQKRASVPPTETKNVESREENKESVNENTESNKRMTVAELFLKESEKDLGKSLEVGNTIEKFDKMDLYRSIFLSDSENEDIKDDDERTDKDYRDKPRNKERNTSPPRGIFANIDFDELNSWKRIDNTKTVTNTPNADTDTKSEKNINVNSKIENPNDTESKNEDFIYGPKIPESFKARIESDQTNDFKPQFRKKEDRAIEINSSSSDSWVDAKEAKKKHKKKKMKKHKSKHKKKHKKKDK